VKTVTQLTQLRFAKPVTRSLASGSLESVWIKCPYPALALGLEEMLKAEAHVHQVHGLTQGEPPSAAILCPSGEDLAAEVKHLRALAQGAPVLVLDLSVDLPLIKDALEAGACGFVHLRMQPEEIVHAISSASEGQVVVPRGLLNDLLVGETRQEGDLSTLTHRQLEILKLVAEGLSNAQIGRQLFISERTVKQHLLATYKLLKVRNRVEAANVLRQNCPVHRGQPEQHSEGVSYLAE
jgi:DNA-binding NarL/FixJ family response regulator